MDTILHVVDVPAARGDVYAAIATEEGLAAWWTTKVEADTEVGGEIRFTFMPDLFNPVMRIDVLDEPNVVEWTCVGGAAGWGNASIRFDLSDHGDGTRLTFRQGYGEPLDDESFGIFNFNWGHYLTSLRSYCESGTGAPFPA
ncbi:MAG TPA: SRPBCC domain-containing protein [Actinomycetota bacterium]|nr:SRPBCC domain-containing protein [Actinomycetota bacterium]